LIVAEKRIEKLNVDGATIPCWLSCGECFVMALMCQQDGITVRTRLKKPEA
jgi:hypothetical protein